MSKRIPNNQNANQKQKILKYKILDLLREHTEKADRLNLKKMLTFSTRLTWVEFESIANSTIDERYKYFDAHQLTAIANVLRVPVAELSTGKKYRIQEIINSRVRPIDARKAVMNSLPYAESSIRAMMNSLTGQSRGFNQQQEETIAKALGVTRDELYYDHTATVAI